MILLGLSGSLAQLKYGCLFILRVTTVCYYDMQAARGLLVYIIMQNHKLVVLYVATAVL